MARTVEVLRLDGAGYRLVGTWDDETARIEPLADVTLALRLSWDAMVTGPSLAHEAQ